MNHSKGKILDMLMELTMEQIEAVREWYKKMYPEAADTYLLLCNYAIQLKKAEKKEKEFIALIETVKNTPSGATNTEQGKCNPSTHEKTGTLEL